MSTNEQIAQLEMVIFRQENKPGDVPRPLLAARGRSLQQKVCPFDDFHTNHQQKTLQTCRLTPESKREKWVVRT